MDGNTPANMNHHPAHRGFTLVEILATLALGILIVSLIGIATTKFIEQRELDVAAQTLVSYLRIAEDRAIQSEGGSPHGVSTADGKLTLFRGSSYASRVLAYDTYFPYPGYIQISGLTEVIFAKQTGVPNTTGNFNVVAGGKTDTITVYSTGAISRQ